MKSNGKKGIIRKGQKKPFRKSTEEEMEERISFAEVLLGKGPMPKSNRRRIIMEEFDVEWRMADHYITRARDRILLRLRQSKEDHRADAMTFYEWMQINPNATPSEQIRARERIDKLLGLDLPQKIEHSGSIGSEIDVDKLKLPLEVREALLVAVEKSEEDSEWR